MTSRRVAAARVNGWRAARTWVALAHAAEIEQGNRGSLVPHNGQGIMRKAVDGMEVDSTAAFSPTCAMPY